MNKVIFFSFCVLVCSAHFVTADEAADKFVKDVTDVLTDLQKFLTSNSDARQAVDKESLQSLKDNIAELRAKINAQTAARSNFLTSNLHDLKDNLVLANHAIAGNTHVKQTGGENLVKEIVTTMSQLQDFLTSEHSGSVTTEDLVGLRDSLMEMQIKMHELEHMRSMAKKHKRVVRQLALSPDDEMILELKDNLEILTKKLKAGSEKDVSGKYKKKAY